MEEKKVLVLNELTEDAKSIEETYSRSEEVNFQVTSVFDAPAAVKALQEETTDLLVFNLHDFSKKKMNAVVDLRKLGIDFPLLSIADTYDEEAYKFVSELDNSVLLNKPFSDKQLLTLSEKIVDGKNVTQRKFPRFGTGERAYLSLYPNGTPSEVEVKDLSKGGACFIGDIDVGLRQGDTIRVRMFLENVEKTHNFFARVMWMDLITDEGRYYIGVQFVSESQIFKSLLSSG